MKKTSNRSGLALLELLIALAVLALAASAGYHAIALATARVDRLYDHANADGDAAIALAVIARDVRSATLERVDPPAAFVAHTGPDGVHLRLARRGADATTDIEYWTAANAKTETVDLWRRSSDRTTMICKTAGAFQLAYFDGQSWRDTWGWDDEHERALTGIRGLPLAVSVHLGQKTATVPVMTAMLNKR